MAASCPSLRCSCRKKTVSCGEEEVLVAELSPKFVAMQWLCSQLCYVTAANRCQIVEIELLATVGWKCGCQPFSCRCTQNVTHCRKKMCWTCLFKESSAAIPFGNSKHPTNPCQKQVPESRSTLQQLCVMAASCPSLRCSCRKKTVSCGEEEVLVVELFSPKFVAMQWLCSQLCYVTAANQCQIVEIELLATVGWKCGCQPFSCRCTQNVTHCRKEICWTCLFKESTPAIPFGNSKHPTNPCQKQVPESRSTLQQLCVMAASCPSLRCSWKEKPVSRREAEELFSPRFVITQWLRSQSCYVTAANQWTIVEIELLATVGWKWGCQPLAAHVRKMWRIAEWKFVRHVCLRNLFRLFLLGIPSIHSLPQGSGSLEPQYVPPVLHFGCIMPIVSLQLQKKNSLMQRSRVVMGLWSPRFAT